MKPIPATASQRQQRSPVRGALVWLLMLAVLFGQGLGAVHSISHGAPGADGHAHGHPGGVVHAQADAPPVVHAHELACDHGDAPGVQAMFSHAPDEPGCRLYDQLLQAGLWLPVPTVLALPERTRTAPPPRVSVHLAAQAAGYLARGPPRA